MTTSLDKAFEEDVRPFIDIIDKLRSLGLDEDVSLPAVVVVGDQSAGKSSVLEAISGVELPRGTNIVTRCPLELRLKKIHKNKDNKGGHSDVISTWRGVISYVDEGINGLFEENIENPSLVGAAVEEATEQLTTDSKGISDSLIHLDVQSETVPDLTLIDLPGIARVAVEGQSSDVPKMTKELIKKYVMKKETIILAVIPCNVDIATTEALSLAQEVDPEGKRTLGVLTKPDLMDKGTEGEVCKIINGNKVRLELGYTVVKCRGQKAIEDKVSLKQAIDSEEEFFKNHELFNNLYQDKKTGIQNLSRRLTKQLVEQIKTNMPSLKSNIEKKLSWTTKELENCGEGAPEGDRERQYFLTNLLVKLGERFKKLARADHIEQDAINGNLRLFAHVKEEFKKLARDVHSLKPERRDFDLKEKISKEIKWRKGKELPSFLSYPVFEGIVRKQIREIHAPAKECLDKVNLIVEKITLTAIADTLGRFKPLQMEVSKLMNEERQKAEKNANDALATMFAMENLVFTQDENFTRLMDKIEKEDNGNPVFITGMKRKHSDWSHKSEQLEVEHMIKCLEAYYEVAATRMIDNIPMTIYYHLVKQLLEGMATEVLKITTEANSQRILLKEDASTVLKRERLRESQKRLEIATMKLLKFESSTYAYTDNSLLFPGSFCFDNID